MDRKTIHNIFKALRLGEESGVGISLNAHEAGAILTWLSDFRKAQMLLRSNYQQTIASSQAEVKRLRGALEKIKNHETKSWMDAIDIAIEMKHIATKALESEPDERGE